MSVDLWAGLLLVSIGALGNLMLWIYRQIHKDLQEIKDLLAINADLKKE
jgi:hypothetical protein